MRRPRLLAMFALAVAVVAFPLGALASHDFADVPDSNIFHADISALVDAGVTSGCGGGNYCPSANVTREQMAAFLNRLGALAPGKTPVVNAAELGGLTANQFARSDQVQHQSCAGSDMVPTLGSVGYSGFGYRYLSGSGGTVACAMQLPDGATVTAFSADVYDGTASHQASCGLTRTGVYGGGATTEDLATTVETGNASALGHAVLTDASIVEATVDNTSYGYSAWCVLSGATFDLGVFKVTVTYTGAP